MSYEIVVVPVGKSRYAARIGERVLLINCRDPLLECARFLQAEGADPQAKGRPQSYEWMNTVERRSSENGGSRGGAAL